MPTGVDVTNPPPAPASTTVSLAFAASWYGPTIGPPPGAPAGTTGSVDVSPRARARFTRPLPTPPSGSAFRASRPTITPGEADGSTASNCAAEPATIAADADVPVTLTVFAIVSSALIPTPGAVMNTAALEFEPLHNASVLPVAPTPTTRASPAG